MITIETTVGGIAACAGIFFILFGFLVPMLSYIIWCFCLGHCWQGDVRLFWCHRLLSAAVGGALFQAGACGTYPYILMAVFIAAMFLAVRHVRAGGGGV